MDFQRHRQLMARRHNRTTGAVIVFIVFAALLKIGLLVFIGLVVTHFVWGWP